MTAGIPVLRTSARIWQVLGGALYRARPLLSITMRELFQNSRDACRGIDRCDFQCNCEIRRFPT
jgi:hypothetical protein